MTIDTQTVEYHALMVSDVEALTDDAVAITFDVPESLVDLYRYVPGQHIAVRADIDGRDVRRTYSVCSNATTNRLRIGVKRLEGGAFSTYATTQLAVGDQLEVTPPHGDFTIVPIPRMSTTTVQSPRAAGSHRSCQ